MDGKPIRILLVDDDEDDYVLTRDLLSQVRACRFDLDWAASFDDGLEAIRRGEHDACLLDYNLGGRSGLDLLRAAVQGGCLVPIILLTGQGDHDVDVEAMEAGADDYVVKNEINAALLDRSIRHALERKRAHDDLRESEARYRLVADNVTDVIWSSDLGLRFTHVTPSVTRLLGYTVEEALTLCAWDVVAPASHSLVEAVLGEYLAVAASQAAGPDLHRTLELELVHKDGSAVWAEVRVGFANDAEGCPIGFVGVVRDISERRRANERILRQSALLEAINRLFRETLTCEGDEDLSRVCLALTEELTGSIFGWIGEVNRDGRMDTIAMSDPGWDACRIDAAKPDKLLMVRDMEIRGVWGEVPKQGRSLIVNDPGSHAARVGLPEGHPPLTSFLGVPLKRGGAFIGMIALANKPSGYDQADQDAVEAVSVAYVQALMRKRAEVMREREVAKLSAMISGMDEGVAFADAHGHVIEVNDYLASLIGRRREDVLGRPIWDLGPLIVPDEMQAAIEGFSTHPGEPPISTQRQVGDAELLVRSQPIRRDGTYDGVLVNVINVTELVNARREAERMNKELHEQAEAMGRARLAALNILDDMQRAKRRLDAQNLELRTMYQQMEAHQVELQRQAEQLMAANAELEQANQQIAQHQDEIILASKLASIGTLAAGIAHEINNPLVAVAGYSETMLRRLEDVTDQQLPSVSYFRKRLQIINDEAFRCKRITHGLLGFSRESSLASPGTFDVRETIDHSLELLAAHARHSPNTSAKVDLGSDPLLVQGDRDKLVQVFLNLGKNAFDAMEPGSLLRVTARRLEEAIEIVYRDEGCGMDQETASRVFDPFFTTKEVGSGTGLGLAVVKGIVEAMGGSIHIESEIGRGTVVTVRLPEAYENGKEMAA
jgi:PAS domain S-box-containing protein